MEAQQAQRREITCVACHGDQHTSATDTAKAKIPTPETCSQCHETQVTQFKKGKHAMGMGRDESHAHHPLAAHGHDRRRKGLRRLHEIGDESAAEVAELRHKSSGTEFGAAQCDACATRHTFSVEEARSPQACETCPHGL